jgi:hypothetical protein
VITPWWWAALAVAGVAAAALALTARLMARERRELRRVTAQVHAVRDAVARETPEKPEEG